MLARYSTVAAGWSESFADDCSNRSDDAKCLIAITVCTKHAAFGDSVDAARDDGAGTHAHDLANATSTSDWIRARRDWSQKNERQCWNCSICRRVQAKWMPEKAAEAKKLKRRRGKQKGGIRSQCFSDRTWWYPGAGEWVGRRRWSTWPI